MRFILRLLLVFLSASSLTAVEKMDPANPKRLPDKQPLIEVTSRPLSVVDKQPASHLYRSWVNPVETVQRPMTQLQNAQVIRPPIQQPVLEQNFSQMKQWKPGRVIRVYEKSKDFEKVLNPLSLRDFNRFIYQRNPSSP